MLTRVGATEANELLTTIDESRTAIIRADEEDEAHARDIICRHGSHDNSLTDAISLAVMDRLGLRRAFTFDDHFSRHGPTIPVEI